VELRLDALTSPPEWDLLKGLSVPVILTNRSRKEGGIFRGGEEERISLLLEGIGQINSCVDIEFSTERGLLKAVVERAKSAGCGLILSHHDFRGTPPPEKLLRIAKRMEEAGADAVKVVTTCRFWPDVERIMNFAVESIRSLSVPVIAFGMGKEGVITRFLSLVTGNPILYAAAGRAAAPGQPDLETALKVLRELPAWEVKD